MMSRNDEEQLDADAVAGAGKFFQTVQPQRDLESNWAVDLSKNLEEYLLKICSGEISGDDGSHLSVNFAEAALLLQGSIQVYSRKVEYLYSLVLHALEFISQKSQQEQTPGGESDQPAESGPNAAVSEENDSFWGLDDIPVDAKNLLDSAIVKETTLNHFVRPPANLVVLEGDCLDANGDAGELETYLLANNDLYRDFILLDSCDAVVVNAFLDGDDKAGKGQSTACRGSSLTSKGRKSFQSPIRRSGSVMLSVGKTKNDASNLSPQFNDGCEFNDCNDGSFPPAYDSPDNNNHEFGTGEGYENSTDSDDSEDDDPWKPLNPHEPGNLKIKPYKRVKANRRRDVGSKKHIFITTEFPLARLHGTISSELNQIWETRRRALGGENQSKSPPLYEKLRQSLTDAGNIDHDAFGNSMDKNENNGFDSDDPDIGPPDFDMPGMDEDLPSNSDENNNGDIHFDNTEAYGDPNAHTSLEDLCRSHLDALLASISETQKQTEMAARVSTWKQRIEQNLEEQDARPPFDIHEYGERVLDKLSSGQDSGNSTSFADVVTGQEKHDVARTFSALLQLVNNGDVDLERVGSGGESTCYTAVNPFYVRFLRHEKKRDDNVNLQLSKKRAKSPMMKGHGRGEKNKPGKENQPVFNLSPSRTNSTCRLSLKVGKSGGIRCTPEGKKRRKSRLIEPVDLHSVE